MEDQINKFRFFIPAIFVLISFALLMPETFTYLISSFTPGLKTEGISLVSFFVADSLLILAIGLAISSFGAFLINFYAWSISSEKRRDITHTWFRWLKSGGDQTQVAKIEFENWEHVSSSDLEYIRNQIDKRWQMFVVNLNMCIALGLVLTIWVYAEQRSFISLLLIVIFIIIFAFNTVATYTSVHSLDDAAARKYKEVLGAKSKLTLKCCRDFVEKF